MIRATPQPRRLTVALVALVGAVAAQTEGFDRETVALLYHKISGEALDFQAVAGMSESVRRASNFDRPGRVVFTLGRWRIRYQEG